MDQEKTLEVSFDELKTIIDELEKEDISLEDSFALYQKGISLLKSCNNAIDKVEKQLIVLGEENDKSDI